MEPPVRYGRARRRLRSIRAADTMRGDEVPGRDFRERRNLRLVADGA
jgi:hypothetical protein